jgi:hypothetical protein
METTPEVYGLNEGAYSEHNENKPHHLQEVKLILHHTRGISVPILSKTFIQSLHVVAG